MVDARQAKGRHHKRILVGYQEELQEQGQSTWVGAQDYQQATDLYLLECVQCATQATNESFKPPYALHMMLDFRLHWTRIALLQALQRWFHLRFLT